MTKTTKETEQENAIFVQANIFLIIKLLLKIYKSTKYIFKKKFFHATYQHRTKFEIISNYLLYFCTRTPFGVRSLKSPTNHKK